MIDIKETALRGLAMVASGSALAEVAIGQLQAFDAKNCVAIGHELERAVGTIETGRAILHSVMVIVNAQYAPAAQAGGMRLE